MMKKFLIFVALLTSLCLAANAQKKYYQVEETYIMGESTLKTTIRNEDNVTLHDINDRFVNVLQTSRDGSMLPRQFALGRVPSFISTDEAGVLVRRIIAESLSSASKLVVKGRRFSVIIIINPDTGRVWEVHIGLDRESPYVFVPPSEFNNIIKRIKNELVVEVTDMGRQLNYVGTGITWEQE